MATKIDEKRTRKNCVAIIMDEDYFLSVVAQKLQGVKCDHCHDFELFLEVPPFLAVEVQQREGHGTPMSPSLESYVQSLWDYIMEQDPWYKMFEEENPEEELV